MTIDSAPSSPENKREILAPTFKSSTRPSSFSVDLAFSPIRESRRVISRRVVNLGIRHSPIPSSATTTTAAVKSLDDKNSNSNSDDSEIDDDEANSGAEEGSSIPSSPLRRKTNINQSLHSSSSPSRSTRASKRLSMTTTEGSSSTSSTSASHRSRVPGLWEKRLASQNEDFHREEDYKDQPKKTLRRILREDLDEDNPFLVAPVVSREKSCQTSDKHKNKAKDKNHIRRASESNAQDNACNLTWEGQPKRKAIPKSTRSGTQISSLASLVSKHDTRNSMAEFHEEGEEGRNVENEITDKEEDMIPKHDRVEPEPLSHLSPQKLVASIGSPIFKTLKRGIHPESRLPYEEEEGEDEEENPWESEAGDDIRAKDELLLRTPQKKRRSQQFDGDHVFLSPGSPGDWLEMQSPRMRRTLNIPESNHEEEEEEGISSPSSPTLKHTAHGRQETPVRKRVYTSNLLEDADPEEVGMSGEEESDPTENNGERKDPSSRTSKRHTPGSMNLDLSNLAMLPPTMSARAWSSSNSSSNNSITPTSSRSVVYDVFQTPPPKSRPVPSPDMKPPPAPSFSPFKAHPMFFNDRSDRDSPVRQKSIRLQKLGTKQPFKTSNSGGSYFDGLDK